MGLLSNRVKRAEIKAGDHIYTWRAVYAYSHHDLHSSQYSLERRIFTYENGIARRQSHPCIYVGGGKVVHFTGKRDISSNMDSSPDSSSLSLNLPSSCLIFPDCGFRQPKSRVILSCLDCFLGIGSLYRFEYGVAPSFFVAKVRGGTCTTAETDLPERVIRRAMYLLRNGFGNYDVFENNCEDFALYCKTGLLLAEKAGVGSSGQASSLVVAPLAALSSSPLQLFKVNPVGAATVAAVVYCISRYATDIGVRMDVIEVPPEDVALNIGRVVEPNEEVSEETEDSTSRSA